MNVQSSVQKAWGIFLLLLLFVFNTSAADKWLNPGPFPVGMDTWFGTVYSTSAQHDYRDRVGGWGDAYYSLVRFDLSGTPQTATQVLLYRCTINDGGTPTAINWYRIGAQWHSGTVTNANFPFASLTPLFWTEAPSPGYWYTIDITNEYNQWRTASSSLNYGLLLSPVNNNNRYSSFYSSTQGGGYGPWLKVTYTPQTNDNIIKLKWPLATAYGSRVVNSSFGSNWVAYCGGLIKKHNGTDFQASAGTAVYAAEDGVVKEVHFDSSGSWAWNVVIEHTHPNGGKFTTVCWHVNPSVAVDSFVPKGMQIGTIANLGSSTHFHFGVRLGAYVTNLSGTGGLPQTNCGDYPAFPSSFIDPNNTSNILFQ